MIDPDDPDHAERQSEERFCPHCGGSLNRRSDGVDVSRAVDAMNGYRFYTDPALELRLVRSSKPYKFYGRYLAGSLNWEIWVDRHQSPDPRNERTRLDTSGLECIGVVFDQERAVRERFDDDYRVEIHPVDHFVSRWLMDQSSRYRTGRRMTDEDDGYGD